MDTWLFYLFGGIALLSAVSVVAQRRVVYSAISLIVCLCALSGIYLLLKAQFIAAVQVIVYAGAIMVLFLFVIMLLDPFSPAILTDKRKQLGYVGTFPGRRGACPALSPAQGLRLVEGASRTGNPGARQRCPADRTALLPTICFPSRSPPF